MFAQSNHNVSNSLAIENLRGEKVFIKLGIEGECGAIGGQSQKICLAVSSAVRQKGQKGSVVSLDLKRR